MFMLVQSQACEWPCLCVLGISVCLCFYDFIEVLVQSQECEWPCLCVLGIYQFKARNVWPCLCVL